MGCFGFLAGISEEHVPPQHVLITGCDSGFGQGLALKLNERGFKIIAACYTEVGAAYFHGKEGIVSVVADLATDDGLDKVEDTVMRSVTMEGKAQSNGLYGLINNAGVCFPGNVEWNAPDVYKKTMDVNFHAPVTLTYRLLPLLKLAKGRIINVTSVDGFISLPTNAAYCASKHALESFSDCLRSEMLPWGVKVVVIQPATMRTPLAMSFAEAWLKGFSNASEDRKAPYGDEWAEEVYMQTKLGLEGIAADPAVTIDAMVQALDYRNKSPPTRIATGKAARWLFKPLSLFPDKTRDSLLHGMTMNAKKPPAGLCAVVSSNLEEAE
jgi:NAD(P)-dependent dehydrogenase (short-subunit alcohol dehydrogenase family)